MLLSLDGGATKTLTIIVDENTLEVKGLGLAGPSDLITLSKETTGRSMLSSAMTATKDAGLKFDSIDRAIYGVCGVGDTRQLTQIGESLVREKIGTRDSVIINDGLLSYSFANMDQDGIVLDVGTGTIVFYKIDDTYYRKAGWDWFSGDNASAAWIARRALNTATMEFDGMLKQKLLVREVESYFGNNFQDAIAGIEQTRNKRLVSGFAPAVSKLARGGYEEAIYIFDEASDYIARMIESILPEFTTTPEISVIGGTMMAGDFYTDMIRKKVRGDVKIYYGYQAAIGGIFTLMKDMGLHVGVNEKECLIDQINEMVYLKDMKTLKKFLCIGVY